MPANKFFCTTEKVLIVDDDVSIVELEKQILQHLGYKVEGKTDSIEALNTFRESPDDFDLVISDMTMPA